MGGAGEETTYGRDRYTPLYRSTSPKDNRQVSVVHIRGRPLFHVAKIVTTTTMKSAADRDARVTTDSLSRDVLVPRQFPL